MTAPVLVFGYGNPSRGDDALGPEFVRRLEMRCADAIACGELEVLTDFQLQVEHALDLRGREQVYFVDATTEAGAPGYAVRPVVAAHDVAFTTHALSPAALLQTYRAVVGDPVPETFVIAIRGSQFELGEAMSEGAAVQLTAALDDFVGRLGRLGGRAPATT
ncbi:MAG: hydrogenase maturation protease [Gemmatimonadetes bacterium]|nr:hydrogenase maturation protease [Gemmatimonadota bacterium]